MIEEVMQPDEYDEPIKDPESFNYEELSSDAAVTVARFYDKQVDKYAKKLRSDLIEVDINGNPWLKSNLKSEDKLEAEAFKKEEPDEFGDWIKGEFEGKKEVKKPAPIKEISRKEASDILEENKYNVVLELETAEAGERIPIKGITPEGPSEITGMIGKKSTFPKWIPSEYRKRILLDRVLQYIENGNKPEKGKIRELYDVVMQEIADRSDLDASKLKELNFDKSVERKIEIDMRRVEAEKEKYLKGIQRDIIEKIHSKLNNKAYIKSITKKETMAIQNQVIVLLEISDLVPHDKSKFIRAIKNIQTRQQLEKNLPVILARIETLTEKASKRTLKAKIKKELDKFKAKKDKKGKTSVEYEMLKGALKKKLFDKGKLRTQAQNEELLNDLQTNIENYDISNPTNYEDFVLYALLSEDTKGLNEMSVGELDETLTRILQTRKIARDSFLMKQLDRAKDMHQNIAGSIENMKGKKVREQTPSNRKTIANKLKQFVSAVDIYDRGFLQIINLLDSIRGGRFYKDVIYQPISEANKSYFQKNDDFLEKDKKMLKSVFNRKGTLLDKQINKLEKQIHIGKMTDAQNNEFDLWFTNSEMIDIYLSSKTKDNLDAMKEQGVYIGGTNTKTRIFYMTDDVLDTIEEKMSKESKKIAEYILENIQDKTFIKEMTTAYEAKYNKPFPFIKDGYWTMRRRYMGAKQKGSDIFNPEYNQQTILSPSSFKQRVQNENPLKISNGWTKYIKWRSDILKFVSYDEALINAKSIIMSQDFKSEFIEIYGYNSYNHLLNSFDVTANGGKNYSDVIASGSNYIRKVLSVSFIGGKTRNILSQGTSFIAAMSDIPIRDFNKGLGKFIAHPRQAYRKMMSSPIIRLRHKRADFTKGLFEEETKKFKQYGLSPTKTAMFFTKVGDMMGVLGAGYVIYDYNYNQYINDGMDAVLADKKAMQDAENFVISTQQSALQELRNAIMQAHPFIRATGAFQQAQSMYRAKGFESMNTWINSENKWSKKSLNKMVKGVFTYHFVLPALYELSRGNINPLSIVAKTTFSPISGFMGWGKVVEYGVMYAIIKMIIPLMGGDDDDWKDILPFDPNTLIGEAKVIFTRTVNSVNDLIEGEEDEKDIAQLIDSSLMLLKVPAKNIREEYYKFKDIFSGEDTSLLRLLQTKWQTKQRDSGKGEGIAPSKSISGEGSSFPDFPEF